MYISQVSSQQSQISEVSSQQSQSLTKTTTSMAQQQVSIPGVDFINWFAAYRPYAQLLRHTIASQKLGIGVGSKLMRLIRIHSKTA